MAMRAPDPERVRIEPADREEWRAWLERHHASAKGAWVAVGKRGNPVTALMYEDAVEEALCFGWIDSTVNRLDEHRFLELFTPRKPTSGWARSNKERVARLIEQGQMTPAGLAAIETAKANGSWDYYDQIEALTVPDDLRDALAARPGATETFASWSASKRQQALHSVASAKRPETRARRIESVATAAAEDRRSTG